MSVHLERCSNALCRRLYEVEHFSPCFARSVMRAGVIECPHCGTTVSAKPSLVYATRAVPVLWECWPEEDVLAPTIYSRSGSNARQPNVSVR